MLPNLVCATPSPAEAQPIRISLFGRLHITVNGQTITNFRSNKSRALLAYLLVEHSQPLLRTNLAVMFWPGYTAESARASLRQALADLRSLFKPIELFHTSRDHIELQAAPSILWCDILQFDELIASWQQHDHSSLAHCSLCQTRLQQALALVQGAFLDQLPNVESPPLQAWLQAKRIYFAEQVAQIQAALAQTGSPPHNLRPNLTSLVGRSSVLTELTSKLQHPLYRCLTLLGPGGIGKTRLALALAEQQQEQFADGVWLVELAALVQPAHPVEPGLSAEQVEDRIATAIGVELGIPFQGATRPSIQVASYLRGKAALLLLDNFEEVILGSNLLLQLLTTAPQLRLLITSRQRLPLQAQLVYVVEGLPTPPAEAPPATLADWSEQYASVQLFVERAQNAGFSLALDPPMLAAIGELCRLVAGSPWAIELAVALLDQHSPAMIVEAIQCDYRALTGAWLDLPPRLRNTQRVLYTTWNLLTPHEATLMTHCAVFRGGFTHAAVQAISHAAPADLEVLIHKSLLHPTADAQRFSLHELVRQFAMEQLVRDPVDQNVVLARHATYYIALVQGQETALLNNFAAQDMIRGELDNIRTAWQWSATQGNLLLLAKGAGALHHFYQLTGLYHEALQQMAIALDAVRQAVAAPAAPATQTLWLLARLLCYATEFHRRIGEVAVGEQLAQEALAVGQQLDAAALQALAYHELARLAQIRGDFLRMLTLAEQGCRQARQSGSAELIAECLNDLASTVLAREHPLLAAPHFQEALGYLAGAHNRYLAARLTANLGTAYSFAHQYQLANKYLQDALDMQNTMHDRENGAVTQIFIGTVAMALGRYAIAQEHYEQILVLFQTIRSPYWENWLRAHYARLLHLRGDPAAARAACLLAQQRMQQNGVRAHQQRVYLYLGHALTELREWEAAESCYQQALAIHQQIQEVYFTLDTYAGLAALALQKNDRVAALSATETVLTFLDKYGVAAAQEPFHIYWICVRVLRATADPRADAVLKTAYTTLQECAVQLEDAALRQSFLENVAANRNLCAAAQAAGLR
ncbi:MAG: hypothetical protein U0350_11585 [Caldilineaceae bacterium]